MGRTCLCAWLPVAAGTVLLMLLAACALRMGVSGIASTQAQDSPSASASVLAYYDWLERAPLHQTLVEATRLLAADLQPGERACRLALLWSVSALASEESRARAQQLLAALPASEADDEWRTFARVWRTQLLLRDKLQAASMALAQAEDARRQAESARRALRRELEQVRAGNAGQGELILALEARIDTLTRQIEALTSIEQQLVEREQEQSEETP